MDGLLPTEEALRRIAHLKRVRWEKGLAEYGRQAHEPFKGDPGAEMMEEVVDALNYLDEERRLPHPRIPLWALNTLEHNLTQAALILLEFKE